MEQIAERYRRRAEAFGAKVAAVRPDQWDNQSPCENWTARDVVSHIIDMHGAMLRPAGQTGPPRTGDPLTDYEAARQAVEHLLSDEALAGAETNTPTGPMTAADHIDRVLSDDLVLHGWDLARATGQDETMDPQDVTRLWASTTAIPPDLMSKYRTPNAFGPGIEVYGAEVPVPPDAPLQSRLLGYVGRQP